MSWPNSITNVCSGEGVKGKGEEETGARTWGEEEEGLLHPKPPPEKQKKTARGGVRGGVMIVSRTDK